VHKVRSRPGKPAELACRGRADGPAADDLNGWAPPQSQVGACARSGSAALPVTSTPSPERSDVDLADDMLRVGWQLQRIDGQLARVPVKTTAVRRALPLVPIARDALIEQAGRQAAARIRAGTSWAGNDLVFTTRTGQPVEPRNLVRSFERLIDGAGLRKIRLHDLRHTVATLLKTLGVAQRDAMQILGHARISVTLEVYTDSDSDSQRDALTRMSDRLFGRAGA
jgi:integrase